MCQDSWGRSCDDRESFTCLPIPPSPPDRAMISTDSSTVQWYKHNQLPFFYLINGIEKRLKNKKSHCTALLCHEWHPQPCRPSQEHMAAWGPSPYLTPQEFQDDSPGTSRGKTQTKCKAPAEGCTTGINSHLKTDVFWLYS